MGYDCHITRAGSWVDSHRDPISEDEWLAFLISQEDLHHTPKESRLSCRWKGDCIYREGAVFDWANGEIFTHNPDQAIIRKMFEIASHFDAAVQGDDGEHYGEDGREAETETEPVKKSGWAFWRR